MTLVQHCGVFGRIETECRWAHVGAVERYAQYERAVCISFCKPRQRRWCFIHIVSNDVRYATLEQNGRVVYDSRTDVPCDMEKWEATRKEWIGREPFKVTHS